MKFYALQVIDLLSPDCLQWHMRAISGGNAPVSSLKYIIQYNICCSSYFALVWPAVASRSRYVAHDSKRLGTTGVKISCNELLYDRTIVRGTLPQ